MTEDLKNKLGTEPECSNFEENLRNFIFDAVIFFFNIIINIFFRDVQTRGQHYIPKKGPVIFVAAPHANQFVDPILLITKTNRRVGFLIAQSSMERKWIGRFARALRTIPVIRAQDLAKNGEGTIYLPSPLTDPLLVRGYNTKFLSTLKPRYRLSLPNKCMAEVESIVSDTELVLKYPFENGVELLTQEKGSKYRFAPFVDQHIVYSKVFNRLNNNKCIGIFPEGGSHDRSTFLPLKAGVTIMALGAMCEYPGLKVTVIPVGLNYFHPNKFRSRAVVEFGKPIEIPQELIEQYKLGGIHKREACSTLLESIYNSLLTVTVTAPDYETLMVIQAARRLYNPLHKKLNYNNTLELTRRLTAGYIAFKDVDEVKALTSKVIAYNEKLNYYGLRDHQVHTTSIGRYDAFLILCIRFFYFLLMFIISFPGFILNLPILVITSVYSKKKAKEAKAKSTVKINAIDVIATWKILVTLGICPLIYIIYSLIAVNIYIKSTPNPTSFLQDVSVFFKALTFIPFISYLSIRFGETGIDLYKSLQPLFLACLPSGRKETEKLRNERLNLQREINALIDEYGPKLIENFDSIRLVSKDEAKESAEFGEKLDLGEVSLSTRKRIFDNINRRIWYRGGNVSATEAEEEEVGDDEEVGGGFSVSSGEEDDDVPHHEGLLKSYRKKLRRRIRETKYNRVDTNNTDVEEYTTKFSKSKRENILQKIKNEENYNDSDGGLSSYATSFRTKKYN
jgi:glycerol-3-phosphate O-acyltransferase/dihydroxyacetone phosphate acyltransferase